MAKRKLILRPATIKNCKVGSTVFDPRCGLGKVDHIAKLTPDGTSYPIAVRHGNGEIDSYTNDGKWYVTNQVPNLFLVPDGITIGDYQTISLEFNIRAYATVDAQIS